MKKRFFFLVALAFMGLVVHAQINTGIYPKSFQMKSSAGKIEHIEIPPLSQTDIDKAMAQDGRGATMLTAAQMIPVDKGVDNAGTWSVLSDGTPIWRLSLSSEGARQVVLVFSEFHLPEGSRLFVYNEDKSMIFGPYTHEDNPESGIFSIGLLIGDHVTVEYEAPKTLNKKTPRQVIRQAKNEDELRLHIDQFSYVFRGPSTIDMGTRYYYDFNSSQYCEVNANCPEGDDWRLQQKGVAHLFVIIGNQGGFCTGSMVNNTANDGRPLFLTAEHCGGWTSETDLKKWIFTFGFETPGCDNIQEQPKGNVIVGAKRLATAGGNGTSDFLLLELNTTKEKLQEWNVVYNGWDREGIASPSGVGLHHPSGDVKKISTYTKPLVSTTYQDAEMAGATNAFWKVTWSPTENGHGITEGGSSGSPLFNDKGYIIGTLTGGSSYCSSPNNPDSYGKVSYHWESNGTDSSRRLDYWLDPEHTGAMRCEPLDQNSREIDFFADRQELDTAGSVLFRSQLSLSVARWQWNFPGGNPSSSQADTVRVQYDEPGYYGVSLEVWFKDGEKKTLNRNDFIKVGMDDGSEQIFTYDFENCYDFAVDSFPPCTTLDKDGLSTYGIDGIDFRNANYVGSFIVGNDEKTQPANQNIFIAHSGKRMGVCMDAFAERGNPVNDDWFITPLLPVKDSAHFSFYASSLSDKYGKERIEVYYIDRNDTVCVSGKNFIEVPEGWTAYGYGIGSTAADSVKWAIRCVSEDATALLIDDLAVTVWSNADRSMDFDIQADTNRVAMGGKVKFSYAAEGEVSACRWNFQGASTESSEEEAPEITYPKPGVYPVSLALQSNGKWISKNLASFIEVLPEISISDLNISFTASSREVELEETVKFTNTTPDMEKAAIDAVLWSFPGGSIKESWEENPQISYLSAGSYDVSLTLFNSENAVTKTEKAFIVCKPAVATEEGRPMEIHSQIYPNPAHSEFHITLPASARIEIFGINGIRILNKHYAEGEHSLNQIAGSGLYLIHVIYDNGGSEVHKLMIR